MGPINFDFFSSISVILLTALISVALMTHIIAIKLTPYLNKRYGKIRDFLPLTMLTNFSYSNLMKNNILMILIVLIITSMMFLPGYILFSPVYTQWLWIGYYLAITGFNFYCILNNNYIKNIVDVIENYAKNLVKEEKVVYGMNAYYPAKEDDNLSIEPVSKVNNFKSAIKSLVNYVK